MKGIILFVTIFGFFANTFGHNSSDHHHHNGSHPIDSNTYDCIMETLSVSNCSVLNAEKVQERLENMTANSTNLGSCFSPDIQSDCMFRKICQYSHEHAVNLEATLEKTVFDNILKECKLKTNSSSTIRGTFSWMAFTLSIILFGCLHFS